MTASNPYETGKLVNEYLMFHYGAPGEILPWAFGPVDALDFAVRAVTQTFSSETPTGRALDIGCAVGRSSIELSKLCAEVVAIDYAEALVTAAKQVATNGELAYEIPVEGALTTQLIAKCPAGAHPERIRFETGDAMALPAALGDFDRILAANLIDRLVEPRLFLDRLPSLVRLGGEVVITSPYTWLQEFTPKQNWLGGSTPGATRPTIEVLQEILAPHFEAVRTIDLPFLIREHARKYQWSVAQASVWRRKRA